MIRVDLLPAYVGIRRWIYRAAVFSTVLIAVTIGLGSWKFWTMKVHQGDIEAAATEAEKAKQDNDNIAAEAVTVKAAVQPTQDKLTFVKLVHEFNEKWPQLYETLAQYTDLKVIYSGAAVSGTTMSIKAYAPSIAEIGRYLERIYEEPDFNQVSIDHLPGYPGAIVKKYYLDGKLVGVGAPPNVGGAAAQGGGGGFRPAGIPGGPGAAGGGGGAGFAGIPSFGGGGGFAQGGGLQNQTFTGERIYTVADVLRDRINPLASPDQVQRAYQEAVQHLVVETEPQGFSVNVTASLKAPLVEPVPPQGY
jgi:hypothetical protein